MEQLKLTQFSPGAGCGCKISPKYLEEILQTNIGQAHSPQLLVGYDTKDDAAVYDLGNDVALISTTDFFTPIVDDPYQFGRIAAANAISDVYAMGGKPLLAISILGWPLEKLSKETAGIVIQGASDMCNEADIALAGGHSISISDPIFGLAVNGLVEKKNIKQNCHATEGCKLFLTKPLGIGLITTAEKHGKVNPVHQLTVLKLMTTLNNAGYEFGKLNGVKAMTDITGFGFLGHLLEICEGSKLAAKVFFDRIPVIEGIQEYIEKKTIPGGTYRNWQSYGQKISTIDTNQRTILCDPQTSGGLLVAVEKTEIDSFLEAAGKCGLQLCEFGFLEKIKTSDTIIEII
jgi:selenide,water dikinase